MFCLHCNSPFPPANDRCPRCGIPLQIQQYQLLPPHTGLLNGKYRILHAELKAAAYVNYRAEDSRTAQNLIIREFFPSCIAWRDASMAIQPAVEAVIPYQECRDLFMQQGRRLAKFPPEAVIPVIETFYEHNSAYWVIPDREGHSMDELFADPGQREKLCARGEFLFTRLAGGLAQLHSMGIYHLEIDLHNVLVSGDDLLWLNPSGFSAGLFAHLRQVPLSWFLPPERYLPNSPLDADQAAAFDIYALAMLYLHLIQPAAIPPDIHSKNGVADLLKGVTGIENDRIHAVVAGLRLDAKQHPSSLHSWLQPWLGKRNRQQIRSNDPTEIEWVDIPRGTFMMGDTIGEGEANEKPVHEIHLENYALSKNPVTNRQFAAFLTRYGRDTDDSGHLLVKTMDMGLEMKEGQWYPKEGYADHPVVGISWFGALEFCREQDGRLPTEAEWEYAARSGGRNVRFGNNQMIADPEEMNFCCSGRLRGDYFLTGIYRVQTTAASFFPANPLGLCDLSGNVYEWCADHYFDSYAPEEVQNLVAGDEHPRVIRGGSWYSYPWNCRATARSSRKPETFNGGIGFRVAR